MAEGRREESEGAREREIVRVFMREKEMLMRLGLDAHVISVSH